MRRLLITILTLISLFAKAQQPPVSWQVIPERKGSVLHFTITAAIQKGWKVYTASPDDGIPPVSISINTDSSNSPHPLTADQKPSYVHDKIFNKKLEVYTGNVYFSYDLASQELPPVISITINGFASDEQTFLPFDFTKQVVLNENKNSGNAGIKRPALTLGSPLAECGGEARQNNSLLVIFLLGIAGGFLALFTPCVFPIIPVTISYFTRKASHKAEGIRNGFVYGSFIILIYVVASLPFHLFKNISPDIFNNIATNPWINIAFFIIFLAFSLSFFGLFEITLPASITNAAGTRTGIFFMALTLATVSFSCTGPILGSLLVSSLSSNGTAWQLTVGMLGFGIALAMPFALFAIFPHWLKKLPRSGGWMKTVKTSLAFIELALALKFLSNADMVQQWGLLKREVFIALWVLVALALAIYLFGAIRSVQKLSFQRNEKERISKIRKAMALFVLIFAIFLSPGIWNPDYKGLKIVSGFPPPTSYSIGTQPSTGISEHIINDYQKALQIAIRTNKPLLIDFTGWACVNCRKMEEQVWTKPEISKLLQKFVVVSLYVDDRKKLPPAEQLLYKTRTGEQKQILTMGDKWSTFQAENFNQVSQPLYILLNNDETLLNKPVGYSDAETYQKWLQCGLQVHQLARKNQHRKSASYIGLISNRNFKK